MLLCCFEAFWGKFTENFSFLSKKSLSQKEAQKYLESLFFSTRLKRGKSRWKLGLVINNPFCTKQKNGTNINKNRFSPENEPHTTKLCFSVILKHFLVISLKTSLFIQKSGFLRKKLRITTNIFFSQQVWKGANLRKIRICLKNFFVQSSKTGQILTEIVFLLKMIHIPSNYAFLLFWIIFGLIHCKLIFLFDKYNRNTQKVCFS